MASQIKKWAGSQGQQQRQESRGGDGKYEKHLPCEACGKSASAGGQTGYFSSKYSSRGVGLVLCRKCADKADDMSFEDAKAFISGHAKPKAEDPAKQARRAEREAKKFSDEAGRALATVRMLLDRVSMGMDAPDFEERCTGAITNAESWAKMLTGAARTAIDDRIKHWKAELAKAKK